MKVDHTFKLHNQQWTLHYGAVDKGIKLWSETSFFSYQQDKSGNPCVCVCRNGFDLYMVPILSLIFPEVVDGLHVEEKRKFHKT